MHCVEPRSSLLSVSPATRICLFHLCAAGLRAPGPELPLSPHPPSPVTFLFPHSIAASPQRSAPGCSKPVTSAYRSETMTRFSGTPTEPSEVEFDPLPATSTQFLLRSFEEPGLTAFLHSLHRLPSQTQRQRGKIKLHLYSNHEGICAITVSANKLQ